MKRVTFLIRKTATDQGSQIKTGLLSFDDSMMQDWGAGAGETNILPNLTYSQEPEPGFFGPSESDPLGKKVPGAGAAREKNQEPEPLEK